MFSFNVTRYIFLKPSWKLFSETLKNRFNIQMTESCSNRIKEIVSKNPDKKFLRLMVDGGGCSGFQYVFKMDNTINKDDEVIERDNTKLVIDSVSLPYLDQATIDYKETLIKSAFLVVENKNAEMNCSCGTSFSPKQEKKK